MKKFTLAILLGILGLSWSITMAFNLPARTGQGSPTEVVNSTSYTKNSDGTVNKIEQITRTTVIDPVAVQKQIDTDNAQVSALQAQKVILLNAK